MHEHGCGYRAVSDRGIGDRHEQRNEAVGAGEERA